MKILYVTTIGGTMSFFNSFIESLIKDGHVVDIACNDASSRVPDFYAHLGCKTYSIQTNRSPLARGNLVAIKQIRDLVEEGHYDIVHCHTPVAAMCTRLACRKARKNGVKIFYTAHGFHFYQGAPLKNWLLYYPIEKLCSYWTDVLITINQEDFTFAQKKMRAKKVAYVPGVGIDLSEFSEVSVDKKSKRQELGIPEDVVLLLSVGELNQNKNHETVIRAIVDMPNVFYIIAGQGQLKDHLQAVINESGLSNRVRLLGFRRDIQELCTAADIYVMPSFREGLSVALMEAMACGLPCVVSKIRGNIDLIDENGGALFDPWSIQKCHNAIENILSQSQMVQINMGLYNKNKVNKFEINTIQQLVGALYDG